MSDIVMNSLGILFCFLCGVLIYRSILYAIYMTCDTWYRMKERKNKNE